MQGLKIEDLYRIRGAVLRFSVLDAERYTCRITVHMGTCGIAAGARKVMDALIDEMTKNNITDIIVTTSGCAGLCSREPMATVEVVNEAPVKYC